MRNDNDVTDYFLFFATNSPKGIQKMKEAMWKVDQSGEFRFSDASDPSQVQMFTPTPDFVRLRRAIVERFRGTETTVAEVEDFVLAETAYRETHYKREVLAALERSDPPQLKVINSPPGRRRGTFADPRLRLHFSP